MGIGGLEVSFVNLITHAVLNAPLTIQKKEYMDMRVAKNV